jgi:hypothetical protein
MSMARDWLLDKDPRESLRTSLRDWLHDDLTFYHGRTDGTFHQLDGNVGEDIDFLIAGHTHLERALKRERGNGYYFNTGTWARLISLTPGLLNDEKAFERVYAAFGERRMEALDQYPGLVIRKPTVVSITRQADGAVRGSLGHVKKTEAGHAVESVKHFDVRR